MRTEKSRYETGGTERAELLFFCGMLGFVGSLTPIGAMIWSSIVAEHDLIADSVSDLARGPHKQIMDVGFYIHAAALVSLAIGAAHAHLGRAGWSFGLFCLALLALVVSLLGLYDKFNAQGQGGSMTVHTQLSFLLGPLYLAGPLLMARGMARVHRGYATAFVAAAVLWLVFATLFKLAPTAYDGILEKIGIAATMLWTVPLSLFFIQRARIVSGR